MAGDDVAGICLAAEMAGLHRQTTAEANPNRTGHSRLRKDGRSGKFKHHALRTKRALHAISLHREKRPGLGAGGRHSGNALTPVTKYSESPKQDVGTYTCWSYSTATLLPLSVSIT